MGRWWFSRVPPLFQFVSGLSAQVSGTVLQCFQQGKFTVNICVEVTRDGGAQVTFLRDGVGKVFMMGAMDDATWMQRGSPGTGLGIQRSGE